jgi:gametolysin peptidase M11/alpha-galactosidase-like protein
MNARPIGRGVNSCSSAFLARPSSWIPVVIVAAAMWALPHAPLEAQGPPPGVGPRVELEGELDVLYEDASAGGRLHYFLDTDTRRRVPLRFQGAGPDLPSGTHVRVAGNLEDDGSLTTTDVATTSITTTRMTSAAVSSSLTLGEQPVLVILINFSNNKTEPYTTTTVDGVNAQVRDLYRENSYQQTVLSFTVTGWHTIAASSTTCDYDIWATQADEAATNAGFNIAAYARRIYAFPPTNACSWWGMSNLAGPRSWINGTYATRVVAHEQGHGFGNRHSHATKCDSIGCVNVDYGDDRDVMGAGGVLGHLNAFQKERLGWLNYGASPLIQTVSTSNDYWIDNYETLRGNTKALKVWNSTTGGYYYIETRDRTGFDASVPAGVTLHTGSPLSSDSSYQIDLDPQSSTWDSTLDIGQAVTDSALGVTFTTLSSNVDGALVRVTFAASACATTPPGVTLSPSANAGAPGATLQYTMTVTNKNSASCAASPFTFSAGVPSGWSSSFSPASLASLAPGASASTTFSLISPSSATGSSSFNLSAVDGTSGLSASVVGSATISVASNLSVAASASVSKSGNTRSATITVSVTNGSLPVSGAAVTVTVTSPTGSVSKLSATTNSSGSASVKYSLKPKDPSGTFNAQVSASAGGVTGTASTSFVMQ